MKTKTEHVEAAFQEVLQGRHDPSLNEAEQRLYEQLATEYRAGKFEAEGEAWRLDFVKEPPSMETFLLDDYYLGSTWRPIEGENEGIWPEWFDLMCQALNYDSRIHNMVITGSLGIGKCWCSGTYVVMYDGTLKKVEDICVGDTLLGDDSTPRTVLSTTRGHGLMYEVHPVKGEPFTVNSDHILVLKSTKSNEITEVTVNDFLRWPRERKHAACLYRTSVNWPAQETLIDPYILGLWLGDGHTTQTVLTTADTEISEAWITYGRSLGLTESIHTAGKGAKAASIQLSYRDEAGTIRHGKNELRNRLIQHGLFQSTPVPGTEKFIPHCYIVNSRSTRLQLLAGLIDTDGSKCSAAGEGTYEITFKLKKLADQTRFLCQSLGYYAQTKVKVVNSTAYYRTIIAGAYDVPVRLPRKKSGPAPAKRISNLTHTEVCYDNSKTRFAITPVGLGDYYGFTLTGNGRCLLQDFTVTHNTVMMVTVILYRVCLACHLKNPQHFFGLNRNSNIVYNFLSVTKEAVKDTAFGNAMSFMADSAFFKEVCKFDPESDYSEYRIEMGNTLPDGRPSRIWLSGGSKGQHVLGRNLIGIGLDEGNFRLEKDPDLKAYELYDQVRTRIANRFQKIASYLPAISVIASSAQDESSFTEKVCHEIEDHNRLREAENSRIEHEEDKMPLTQTVFRNAVYKIKRHALTGIGPDHHWFKVAYGLKNMEPFILSGWYREDGSPIETAESHEEPPHGAKTELVPKFYWEAFRRNCKAQLQNLSGISVGGAHRLFPSLLDIEQCLTSSKDERVPDPMLPGVQRIPLSVEDDKNVWDFLNHRSFLTRVASRIQPVRHPQYKRYAHIDLATQTLAGVAICHLAGSQLVDGLVKDGQPFAEYRLIVEYDFILTICAGQNKPINLEKIQRFFFWLRDMCGYQFGLITADMFQCLTGDTLVDTDHGLIPVSEVRPGYIVHSTNGPARVTRNFQYRAVPVLRVTTDHNEVVCGTPNHRLLAADNCERPHTHAQYAWKQLKDLKPGDVLGMVQAPVCVQGRKREARATWLGLYWGDGCLKTGQNTGTVSLTCAKEHVAEAVAACQQATGLSAKIYWSPNQKSAEVSVHSRSLVRWMLRNGYRKAPQKSGKTYEHVGLPLPILKANRKTQAAFLRGLFSADGSVDDLGTVTLSTKHSKLAQQVAVLLRTQFGLRSNIVRSYRQGFDSIRRVQWIVQVGGSRQTFYDLIGFCFSDKQSKLSKHMTKKGRRLVSRVRRIEHDTADVYDIEVEGARSYTANGFISHNSEMPLQTLEARGFEVDKLSVDRDKSVYTAWRTGFEERRIRLHRNEQMLREAEQLLEMDKKFDHPPDGSKDSCFIRSTKIRTIDGKIVTLGALKAGSKLWVYGLNKGHIQAAQATALGLTRRKSKVLKVTLDNGRTIICTPDHLLMLRDETYRPASLLQPGDRLMPFYFRRLKKGYATVYNPATSRYERVYHLIDEQFRGPRPKGFTVHHLNHRKRDDRPENLQRLTNADHWALHRNTRLPDGIKTERRRIKRLQEHNAKPETKAAQSKRMDYARQFCDFTALGHANGIAAIPRLQSKPFRRAHSKWLRKALKTNSAYKAIVTAPLLRHSQARKVMLDFHTLTELRNADLTNEDICQRLGVTLGVLKRRIRDAKRAGFNFKTNFTRYRSQRISSLRRQQVERIESLRLNGQPVTRACTQTGITFPTYKKWLSKLNHRVLSVEEAGYRDVTCLRTDLHNFALEAGVFVHNCDAAAGAYFNAINSDEKLMLSSHNYPAVYSGQALQQTEQEKAPVDIPLPPKGYTRIKIFDA